MKKSFLAGRVALLAIIALLSPTLGHAQTNQVYIGGPTNTWDSSTTSDWINNYPTYSPTPTTWAGGYNDAIFNVPSTTTVAVSGAVSFDTIDFYPYGGAYSTTITGPGTLNVNPYDGSMANPGNGYFIFDQSNVPETISSKIVLSDLGSSSGGQNAYIYDQTANLTIGSIDWASYTINTSYNSVPNTDNNSAWRIVNIQDQGGPGATVTLNGTYTNENYTTSGNTASSIAIDDNGTGSSVTIAPSANFSTLPGSSDAGTLILNSGTLNLDNSTFTANSWINVGGNPDSVHTINLVGSQTINASTHENVKNGGTGLQGTDGIALTGEMTVEQSGAGESTWAGAINQDGSNTTFGATTANSRLDITGNVGGATPLGLTFSGPGVVVLANPAGNNYTERDGNGNLQPTSTVAATINSGATVLIDNTSGSAFGGQYFNYGGYYNNVGFHTGVVNVNGGGALGGTGISTNPVVALAGSSILAPGDPTVANGIGTLTLSGGLTATSGVTLDFKLDGANNSTLSITGNFTPGGTLTVNLARTSANLLLDQDYYLMFADMAFNGTPGTDFNLVFNAPLYYKVSSYDYDNSNGFLSVEFELVPEPSTYALMFAGLGFLAFCVRRKAAQLK